jgi:hypothetical protein
MIPFDRKIIQNLHLQPDYTRALAQGHRLEFGSHMHLDTVFRTGRTSRAKPARRVSAVCFGSTSLALHWLSTYSAVRIFRKLSSALHPSWRHTLWCYRGSRTLRSDEDPVPGWINNNITGEYDALLDCICCERWAIEEPDSVTTEFNWYCVMCFVNNILDLYTLNVLLNQIMLSFTSLYQYFIQFENMFDTLISFNKK